MKRVKADIGLTERPRVLRAVASARTALDRRLRAIPGMRYVLAACGIVTPFGWLVIASAIAGLVVAGVVGWAEALARAQAWGAPRGMAIVRGAAPPGVRAPPPGALSPRAPHPPAPPLQKKSPGARAPWGPPRRFFIYLS